METKFIACTSEDAFKWVHAGAVMVNNPGGTVEYYDHHETYKSDFALVRNHGNIKVKHSIYHHQDGVAQLLELKSKNIFALS